MVVANDLGFDPAALRSKYLAERDKRLHKDRGAQYLDLAEAFPDLADDPHSDPGFSRPSVEREIDVVVLGGGLAGLTVAAKLRQAGVEDLCIVEQGGDFGGAWYWNRYPGVRCDIESYIYMPLLEETGTIPSEKYAPGAEIQAHCRKIGELFNLYDGALFQTAITEIRWNEEASRWFIRTDRGDLLKARHLLASNGPFHRPKVPKIPGILDFKGAIFHSSRWNYDYTGGDSTGNLIGLAGKRVALVGNGATGIQIAPHVARYAQHLYVVQRTPSAVDARNNRPTDVEWFKAQAPGWQQQRMDNFMLTMLGEAQAENMVKDCWTDMVSILSSLMGGDSAAAEDISVEELVQLADYTKMERVRERIGTIVKDPEVAEKLKPWYNLFCKRPLFSDDYLQMFNRDNVTLIDTNGHGVEAISEHGFVVNGITYDVDCIIFATGFEVNAYSHRTGGYALYGLDDIRLEDAWAGGMRSVHGNKIAGFPNFQILGAINQASIAWNYPHVMARQANHAARAVKWSLDHGTRVEVSAGDEQEWLDEMERCAIDRQDFYTECTPGYYNNDGDVKNAIPLFARTYGGGPVEYMKLLDRWENENLSAPG